MNPARHASISPYGPYTARGGQVCLGGFSVYPREVEDALLAYPGVLDDAAFGVPDERWGERVMAAFVPAQELDIAELEQFARDRKGPIQTSKYVVLLDSILVTALDNADPEALRTKIQDDDGER